MSWTGLAQALQTAPYALEMGTEIETLSPEGARLRLPYNEGNTNPGRALHGGVGASLVQMGGMAVARAAMGEAAGPFHTASIQIDYLAAAVGQAVVAEARLRRKGKEVCFVEVDLTSDDGKPIIHGMATVRGRFGAEEPPVTPAAGDDGQSDPGPFSGLMQDKVFFTRRLGVRTVHMAGSRSRLVLPWLEANSNGAGGVHEGAMLALLDTTGAMAAWAGVKPGAYRSSTVGLNANMVTAGARGDLVAYGRLARRDREIFWSEVEIAEEATGALVARGAVLYRIVIPDAIPWA